MPEHDLFLELHIPLEELLSAFDTARLRPELLINSGPLAFFLWENKEGWPVKDASESVYELTGYTVEDSALYSAKRKGKNRVEVA
jgi:hypothetical protein